MLIGDGRVTGCVLDLPMQEGAGAVVGDRSRFKNNGAITGATWITLPSGKCALSFDGINDVVACADPGQVIGASNLTALIWVSFTDIDVDQAFFNKKDTTYDQLNGWHFYWDGTGHHLQGRGSGSSLAITSGVTNFSINTFYHLAMTAQGADTTKFYANGVFVASIGTFESIVANSDTLRLGKLSNDYPSWMKGKLASPIVLNRVLSPGQIWKYYQATRGWFGV